MRDASPLERVRQLSGAVFLIEPGRAPTRVRARSLSASEIEVSWKALPWSVSKKRVLGYEVSYSKIKAWYLFSYYFVPSACWCTSTRCTLRLSLVLFYY